MIVTASKSCKSSCKLKSVAQTRLHLSSLLRIEFESTSVVNGHLYGTIRIIILKRSTFPEESLREESSGYGPVMIHAYLGIAYPSH